ncbi:MAG TPA: helix-turn-helix domain-containing protein [Actinophytocola sp.]|jgi:DNA-binding IclR family transcriptional regulator|uniref:helix-turn-helix domain-containing protein n=1 Tax=Actinophytocola sp. TaxID=1872138 RepID=UPI002E03D2C0|nr:helix-turn-helix domain-containing protein [Actinophytocola sp.]
MNAPLTLSAVDKALVILTVLTTSAEPLPLAEVSRRCGLPKPTAHRLLATLCAHNMITRSGVRYLSVRGGDDTFLALLKSESTPYLVELHNTTGATATVSALVNGNVQHLNQVYGHRGIRVTTATAADLVLQAYDPDPTPPTARDLLEIRRAGIASLTTARRGVVSLAVPLCGNGTAFQAAAALSIVGRLGGFDPAGASRELRRCAYELTRTLKRFTSTTMVAS